MKRAPLLALGAIALFLAALASSRRPALDDTSAQALDFTGVEALEIDAGNAEVALVDAHRAASVDPTWGGDVEVLREGSTLTLRHATPRGYLQVVAPATLRRIVVRNATIEARVPVVEIALSAHGSLSWTGDAQRLRFAAADAYSCAERCGGLKVEGGAIGALLARTANGTIALRHADDIGHIELELGEDADYELGGLRGPPPSVVLRGPGDVAPPREATVAPAPDAPPTEPPRSP